jgi:hypothetical protein
MFVGRDVDLDQLVHHLKSPERVKTYMLFGLTRMGKSSVLDYLEQRIDLQPTEHRDRQSRFFAIRWDFSDGANQKMADMWRSFLNTAIVQKAKRLADEGRMPASAVPRLSTPEDPHFEDWKGVLKQMQENALYPVFLIDEFTYYKELYSKGKLKPSFLAAIRNFAISGMASFVFAGTYDLRELIRDHRYGITGQLVNVVERRIGQIEEKYARKLIVEPMPGLKFTDAAVVHLLRLSWRIPYFLQMLCKNIALFCNATGRSHIGYPDVELVVECLVGESQGSSGVGINSLPPNAFLPCIPNLEQKHCDALLTTLCEHLRGQRLPSPMCLQEIKEVWQKHAVPDSEGLVAEAVKELKDREVLIESSQDGRATYQISVDLFRRWWANEHRFLEPDLDLLKVKKNIRRGGPVA